MRTISKGIFQLLLQLLDTSRQVEKDVFDLSQAWVKEKILSPN